MTGAITDVAGVAVGHWSDHEALTGCTVVLLPEGTVASGEVRGGAPGTRELELLRPERKVAAVDAVVLSGGSAFGLAACDGVMAWLAERGRGFPTGGGPVPIVVGMVLFDLMVGDGSVRPTAANGRAACEAAMTTATSGRFGAGTGATVDKWRGREHARPAGIGTASVRLDDLVVGALVAVNASGDIRRPGQPGVDDVAAAPTDFEHTTIGVIATNARLDKLGCLLVSQAGHDGFARALEPVHSTVDGDALVAAATGEVDAPVDVVARLAARAVEAAIRAGVPPIPG